MRDRRGPPSPFSYRLLCFCLHFQAPRWAHLLQASPSWEKTCPGSRPAHLPTFPGADAVWLPRAGLQESGASVYRESAGTRGGQRSQLRLASRGPGASRAHPPGGLLVSGCPSGNLRTGSWNPREGGERPCPPPTESSQSCARSPPLVGIFRFQALLIPEGGRHLGADYEVDPKRDGTPHSQIWEPLFPPPSCLSSFRFIPGPSRKKLSSHHPGHPGVATSPPPITPLGGPRRPTLVPGPVFCP